MNGLTRTLLASVALCALTGVAAAADSAAPFHLTALHGGRVINKTKLHNRGATHIYSTFSVFTYVPASSYRKTENLYATFYRYSDPCSVTKMKVPKKGLYGKIGIVTETHNCGGVVKTIPIGNSYKLTDPNAKGEMDYFESSVSAKFRNNGTKYKGTMSIHVSVIIY